MSALPATIVVLMQGTCRQFCKHGMSFCLVKSRGFAHLVALGLVSMMLRCVIVKIVELVDLIEMRKTGCSGETRLVPHVPSSS